MNVNSRFWEWLQIGCCVLILILSYLSGGVLQGVLALAGIGLGVFSLCSPTPEQRVKSQIQLLQNEGLYPPKGEGNDEYVSRLSRAGHKLLAIRLYGEIHGVTLKQAMKAVNQLT